MEVVTNYYEIEHGKRPSGAGRWAFGNKRETKLEDMIWANGTYGEAKKAAVLEAKQRGWVVLYVQS